VKGLALGCTSEEHPLYGPFMTQLSSPIFEHDKQDYQNCIATKVKELQRSSIKNYNNNKMVCHIYSRRRTKSVEATTRSWKN